MILIPHNYNVNNNYRFVEMCIQRVFGRDLYSEREKLAWSIIIASKGLEAFVDSLLDSDEVRFFHRYNRIIEHDRFFQVSIS